MPYSGIRKYMSQRRFVSVALTTGAPPRFARARQRGQQNGRQNADNSNHNRQFDQCKTIAREMVPSYSGYCLYGGGLFRTGLLDGTDKFGEETLFRLDNAYPVSTSSNSAYVVTDPVMLSTIQRKN